MASFHFIDFASFSGGQSPVRGRAAPPEYSAAFGVARNSMLAAAGLSPSRTEIFHLATERRGSQTARAAITQQQRRMQAAAVVNTAGAARLAVQNARPIDFGRYCDYVHELP